MNDLFVIVLGESNQHFLSNQEGNRKHYVLEIEPSIEPHESRISDHKESQNAHNAHLHTLQGICSHKSPPELSLHISLHAHTKIRLFHHTLSSLRHKTFPCVYSIFPNTNTHKYMHLGYALRMDL